MENREPDYGFGMQSTDDGTLFTVSGVGLGASSHFGGGCLGVIGGLFVGCLLGLFTSDGRNFSHVVPISIGFGILGLIVSIVIVNSVNQGRNRTSVIGVTPTGIAAGDRLYSYAHITQILVGNSQNGKDSRISSAEYSGGSGIFIGGTGLAGVAVVGAVGAARAVSGIMKSTGQAAGDLIANDMVKKGYYVAIVYGSEEIKIASHLTHTTAITLMQKIMESVAPDSSKSSSLEDLGTKKCPSCAETIKFEAIKCRYCGHIFDPAEVNQQVEERRLKQREIDVVNRKPSDPTLIDIGLKSEDRILSDEPALCPKCHRADYYRDGSGDCYCPNCKTYIAI